MFQTQKNSWIARFAFEKHSLVIWSIPHWLLLNLIFLRDVDFFIHWCAICSVNQSIAVFLLQVVWSWKAWNLKLWYRSLSISSNAAMRTGFIMQRNILKMPNTKRKLVLTFHWKIKESKWLPTEILCWSWSISRVCLKGTLTYLPQSISVLWIQNEMSF